MSNKRISALDTQKRALDTQMRAQKFNDDLRQANSRVDTLRNITRAGANTRQGAPRKNKRPTR